jgi:hypothetical protein
VCKRKPFLCVMHYHIVATIYISEAGRMGLRANPKKVESVYEDELKAHREKIGELVLQIDVLKKAKKILEEPEEGSSSSE